MKYYINVRGGLGLNFGLARVISQFGSDHDFYIKSPYWDVFKAHPLVKHVYKPEESRDFLMDAINDDAQIIQTNLYDQQEFIRKQFNYTQAWCKLLGLKFKDTNDGTSLGLELDPFKYFPDLQQKTDEIMQDLSKKGYQKFLLVQFWGGQSPLDDYEHKAYSYEMEPLKRAYPVEKAQEFVDLYRKEHPDTAVVVYELPNEPYLRDTERYTVPYLVYYALALAPNCVGAVTIDSSLAHIISGKCKVVTIWGHSLPNHFGYSCNKNIIQHCNRNDILYFTELGPSGARIDYIEPAKLLKETDDYLQDEAIVQEVKDAE